MSYAEKAVGHLKANQVPASPRNYELWYTYVSGFNRALNRALNEAITRYGSVPESVLQEIYEQFLSPSRITDRVQAVGDDFLKEFERVIGAIDEAQIGSVAVGQDVEIRVDAYRNRVFSGRVHRVSPLGVNASNVVTFDVEIVVTDREAGQLRSGMSANVEIITNRQEQVLLIPLTAVRSHGDEHTVLRPDGSPHNITIGGTDGSNVVVTGGLDEGDEILADPTEPRPAEGSPPSRGRNPLMGGGGRRR